jgi:hypothetical protein
MNARQRRANERRIKGDHFRWPLGTLVVVRAGHHSPAAVGLAGKVNKHGYPCRPGANCIVVFETPVPDLTFGAARFGHYVDFRYLRRAR